MDIFLGCAVNAGVRAAATRDRPEAWKEESGGWRLSEAFIAELSRVRVGGGGQPWPTMVLNVHMRREEDLFSNGGGEIEKRSGQTPGKHVLPGGLVPSFKSSCVCQKACEWFHTCCVSVSPVNL